MNGAVAILALEAIILVCGGIFLHQKNPDGFNRVVSDVEALVSSVTSGTPAPDNGTPPASAAAHAPVPPTAAKPAPSSVTPALTPPAPAPAVAPAPPVLAPPAPASTWTLPAALPAQPNWTWTTIAGRTYTNVRVLSVDHDSVMITYDGGGERVPLAFLPPDLQKLFNHAPGSGAPGDASTTSDPSAIGHLVAGNLVRLKDGQLAGVPDSALEPAKYIAIYYSAQWCPPCHAFTPQLVQFYNQFKPAHPDFDLIFISEDHDEGAMTDYMREMSMPWLAVTYNQLSGHGQTFRQSGIESYANSGIPDLVLVDSSGKVLSDSFQNGTYVGPETVVADIQKMVK